MLGMRLNDGLITIKVLHAIKIYALFIIADS